MADDEGTSNEIERLRTERDALKAELERQTRARGSRTRRIVTVVLIVLAIVSLAAATPGAWARRTLFDTDRYVATVGPLASDPAVQEALARKVTDAVFDALGVQERISALLADRAPQLGFIAAPLTEGLHDFVQGKVLTLVQSEAFATYWTGANRVVHEQAIAALRGESEAVSVQDGAVTLNYLPLVNDALQQVSQTVSDLIGRPLDLPEVTPETVPSEAIAAIEAATGLDLPDTFGSVVVYDADEVAAVQQAFRLFNGIVLLLILLVIATTVAALWVSPRKRRTLLQLTVGFAIVLVVERRLAIAGANALVGNVAAENQAAARAVVDALLGTLLRYTGWLLAAALVTLAIALLSGPYGWAKAIRTGVVELGRSVSGATTRASEGGVGVWVAGHRDVLMLAGAAVGVLGLLLFDLSLAAVLVLGAVLVLFELFVYRAGATQES